jgi:hypothetical protein
MCRGLDAKLIEAAVVTEPASNSLLSELRTALSTALTAPDLQQSQSNASKAFVMAAQQLLGDMPTSTTRCGRLAFVVVGGSTLAHRVPRLPQQPDHTTTKSHMRTATGSETTGTTTGTAAGTTASGTPWPRETSDEKRRVRLELRLRELKEELLQLAPLHTSRHLLLLPLPSPTHRRSWRPLLLSASGFVKRRWSPRSDTTGRSTSM